MHTQTALNVVMLSQSCLQKDVQPQHRPTGRLFNVKLMEINLSQLTNQLIHKNTHVNTSMMLEIKSYT